MGDRASGNETRNGQIVPRPTESLLRWERRGLAMTDDPIDLDDHRSSTEQFETEMRRSAANSQPSSTLSPDLHFGSLEEQMLAEPARTWVEVMEKWRFLLDRYAATPEAGDERIQKLINRALGDMARLKKREERN
jgi:hypothetical protein